MAPRVGLHWNKAWNVSLLEPGEQLVGGRGSGRSAMEIVMNGWVKHRIWRLIVVVVGAAILPGAWQVEAVGAQEGGSAKCDGPDVDPWLSDLRDRVMSYGGLVHFAVRQYGAPTACEGAATTDFDGAKFGNLRLSFVEGVTFEVQTMPPESSVSTLRASSGFGDESLVRQALRQHTTDIGLAIDWTAPEVTMEGAELVHVFWDSDPGLNASASLIFAKGKLVAVRVSMAL